MKNFLSITVLFFLFSAICIPQSFNSAYRSGSNIFPQAVTLQGRLSAAGEVTGRYISPYLNSQTGSYQPVVILENKRFKSTYTYNSSGSIKEILEEDMRSSTYVRRTIYTYDGLNRLAAVAHDDYGQDSGVFIWKLFYRDVYVYDTLNSSVVIYHEEPSDSGGCKTVYRSFLKYDEKGNILSDISESMYEGAWSPGSGSLYTYDKNGNRLSYTYQMWKQGAWENYMRNRYSYDSGNRLTSMMRDWWKDGKWETTGRRSYEYDSQGRNISIQEETLKDSSLVLSGRTTNTYSNSDNTEILEETLIEQAWMPVYQAKYEYDNNHNCIKADKEQFNPRHDPIILARFLQVPYNAGQDELIFLSADSVEVEYSLITGVEDEINKAESFTLSQNYPNPFNPSTTINYSTGREGMVRLTVYDALGRMAAVIVNENKPAGSYSVKFDGSRYPSGVYFYRLESGGMTLSRKFVLVK